MAQCLHVAGALDAGFVQIHRAGHVDGQHQFDVDINRPGGRLGRASSQGKDKRQHAQHRFNPLLRAASSEEM
ncbi:hypothetical protein D3C72_2081140 [compost metagenome]